MRTRSSKKKRWFLLAVAAVLLIPLIVSYASYLRIHVGSGGVSAFERALTEAVRSQEPFQMQEVTDFEWDRMIIGYPYMSKEELEAAAGVRWTNRTYPGYLLERYVLKDLMGDLILSDESVNKVVFISGGKVVLETTLYRDQADFTGIKGTVTPDRDEFKAEGPVLQWLSE